jgi:hypothetical protein
MEFKLDFVDPMYASSSDVIYYCFILFRTNALLNWSLWIIQNSKNLTILGLLITIIPQTKKFLGYYHSTVHHFI